MGIEAQRTTIDAFAASRGAEVLARFTEVESGRNPDRPELGKAIHLSRLTGATLVIAKLDRLSRNAAFLLTLRDSGVKFLACDMPEANDLTVGIMALVAQQEREAISRRTKEALAVAKEVIRKDAIESGRQLGERFSGDSLETLLEIVERVWAEDGTMEITNVELTDRSLRFDVIACGYAELYKRLGIRDLGCVLSCDRDFAFMDGFNPAIRLHRTQTIMEGADHCDFRYEGE